MERSVQHNTQLGQKTRDKLLNQIDIYYPQDNELNIGFLHLFSEGLVNLKYKGIKYLGKS